MVVNLYTKNKGNTWAKFLLHLPTFTFRKKERCDFGDDYRKTEVNFGTLFRIRTSHNFFHIKVKILGFGFEGTVQEVWW